MALAACPPFCWWSYTRVNLLYASLLCLLATLHWWHFVKWVENVNRKDFGNWSQADMLVMLVLDGKWEWYLDLIYRCSFAFSDTLLTRWSIELQYWELQGLEINKHTWAWEMSPTRGSDNIPQGETSKRGASALLSLFSLSFVVAFFSWGEGRGLDAEPWGIECFLISILHLPLGASWGIFQHLSAPIQDIVWWAHVVFDRHLGILELQNVASSSI